ISTVAADFSSGAHSVVSKDDNGERIAFNDLLPTGSDITVAAYGSHFYRIERAFSGNSVTKFSTSEPQTPIWQYSTNDAGSAVLSNPHDMIFVSETKAYVLRYGSNTMWIVDPSAESEDKFKIGEIDLSSYDDADGVPEMDSGVIVDGKLYVTLQRLDNFAVTQTPYVAIFDVITDEEIDANIAGDSLKGIPLQTRNPTNIVYEQASNVIFVQGSGSFFPVEYTSGVEKIDLSTLSATVILDDGDDVRHPYGLVSELAVVSDTILYFVGYDGFTDNTLYRLDLSTAEITATSVTSLINGQMANLTVDSEGLLWVSDSANATVRIIDPQTDTEVDALFTNLNPEKIVFAE
ncbi:MAG: hypothetical protein GQ550_06645, partial [Gammaproteobacteria bacterium]|nr:hypothetical protein [Gammaproteobacteria bacterium]